ncbi:MAG: AlpA family phage regulatory protein [Oceanisphaera sp.]
MCALLNRDRRTLWFWVKNGKFPQPLKINGRTVGWRASEYRAWLDSAR